MTPNVKRQNDVNTLLENCRTFWAFSREQLEEGKKKINLQEGEKLVDIGMGGFMPKANIEKYINGLKEIDAAFKQAMKDQKARQAHIAYELDNHEAYYSMNIDSTMDALGEDFTREEVAHVFKHSWRHLAKHNQN